jgi:hypothetical protein
MKLKKTVSSAVRQKNQTNSKKSTGPKSDRGKAVSRFNAVKHGLTAQHLIVGPDGQPLDSGLNEIMEALHSLYGSDVVAQLLIDNLAVDAWRQRKGLEAEMFYLSRKDWAFHPQGSMSTLLRYNNTNRRAMLKNLELLETLQCTATPAVSDETSGECETEVASAGIEQSSQTVEKISKETEVNTPTADALFYQSGESAEPLATEDGGTTVEYARIR